MRANTSRARAARRPITWEAIAHWLDWLDKGGFNMAWKKARVDGRLITIAPALAGMISHVGEFRHSSAPMSSRKAAVAMATRSTGTYDAQYYFRENRINVVAD